MMSLKLRIHSRTDKSVVKVKLISFSNNLQIIFIDILTSNRIVGYLKGLQKLQQVKPFSIIITCPPLQFYFFVKSFTQQLLQLFLSMIVLFLNLHRDDDHGRSQFNRYYSLVSKILKQTLYYGNHYQQQIRTRQNIQDYLYDDQQRSNKQKSKQKFKSVSYIFIDGSVNLPPWSSSVNDIRLLIRNSLKEGKKVHFNGFGHLALYYLLSTGFEKQCCIKRRGEEATGKEDYFHEEETGDLYAHGKKICNSGIQVLKNTKTFQTKSHQALQKGVIIPTKFHILAFNSKNGQSLIKDIRFPFTFFQKHKVFCTPILSTRANITCLIQTQGKIPIAFTYPNCLSTHLLCLQTSKLLLNWIISQQQVAPLRKIQLDQNNYLSDIAFNNQSSLRNTKILKSTITFSTIQRNADVNRQSLRTLRPQTAASMKSKQFDKPSVRCSGPYDSIEHMKTIEQLNSRDKLFGRSRMNFKSEIQKNEIKNYVQRTPSRPPSAHNFREIDKSKWLNKKTFFVT